MFLCLIVTQCFKHILLLCMVDILFDICLLFITLSQEQSIPDSKVHGDNMGPTWVLSAPDGSHVGPMDLAIRDYFDWNIGISDCPDKFVHSQSSAFFQVSSRLITLLHSISMVIAYQSFVLFQHIKSKLCITLINDQNTFQPFFWGLSLDNICNVLK